jgi:hypothetical protein
LNNWFLGIITTFLHSLEISLLGLDNHWLELSRVIWNLSKALWCIEFAVLSLVFLGLRFHLIELWLNCFHVFALIDELLHLS